MKNPIGLLVAGSAWLCIGSATAFAGPPQALPGEGPVSVSWEDPSSFSEVQLSRNPEAAVKGDWVVELASYMRDRIDARLPQGQQLDIVIEDIDRAGDYIRRDVTARQVSALAPPRIDLRYVLLDAQGQVIDRGETELVDAAFLNDMRPLRPDELQYEKQLIDRWIERELLPG